MSDFRRSGWPRRIRGFKTSELSLLGLVIASAVAAYVISDDDGGSSLETIVNTTTTTSDPTTTLLDDDIDFAGDRPAFFVSTSPSSVEADEFTADEFTADESAMTESTMTESTMTESTMTESTTSDTTSTDDNDGGDDSAPSDGSNSTGEDGTTGDGTTEDGTGRSTSTTSQSSSSTTSVSSTASTTSVSSTAPPAPSGPVSPEIAQALRTLEQHLAGSNASNAELTRIKDQLKESERDFASAADIRRGIEFINNYEAKEGPPFTDAGTMVFSNKVGESLLEQAVHEVYLGLFDAVNAETLQSQPELVGQLAFASAETFPGSVPKPSNPNAVYEMRINASVPADPGWPNMYSKRAAVRPTGTYLAPGTVAEITVPQSLVNKGFAVQVGAHTWDLSERPRATRLARAAKTYPITSTTTRVANPLGGNIYIVVPHLADEGLVTVKFKNTGRAPFFSARGFDDTSVAQWRNSERYHPGAWADIESKNTMMNVPAKWIRDYDDPTEILTAYDNAMDSVSTLMGRPSVRNKTPLYFQVDTIFRGVAFFPGYPMSNFPNFASDEPKAPLTPGAVRSPALWHEHGHATHITKFADERESIVHLPYVYLANTLWGMSIEEAYATSLIWFRDKEVTMADSLNSWILTDRFLNNENMVFEDAGYQLRGHGKYVEIARQFGWDVIIDFNKQINRDYDAGIARFPRNNHPDNDRILRLSKEAGVDLRPLIHLWGRKPADQEALAAELAANNLGPSRKIYDLLVSYRETVPMNQAEYDDFYSRMEPVVKIQRGFFANLAENYDVSRGRAVQARIDELLDYYFPAGRP